MSNTININGIEITVSSVSGKFAKIVTTLTFRKDGKTVKECSSFDLERFVRPENRAAVQAVIDATRAAVAESDEHKASVARHAELDRLDDGYDTIHKAMAL